MGKSKEQRNWVISSIKHVSSLRLAKKKKKLKQADIENNVYIILLLARYYKTLKRVCLSVCMNIVIYVII